MQERAAAAGPGCGDPSKLRSKAGAAPPAGGATPLRRFAKVFHAWRGYRASSRMFLHTARQENEVCERNRSARTRGLRGRLNWQEGEAGALHLCSVGKSRFILLLG